MALSKKTSRQIEKEANDRVMQTVAWRASFYRANPQRFVKDYLCVNLKWFQVIILWTMFHMNYVMYLAARGRHIEGICRIITGRPSYFYI